MTTHTLKLSDLAGPDANTNSFCQHGERTNYGGLCGETVDLRQVNRRIAFGGALKRVKNNGYSTTVETWCRDCRAKRLGGWRYAK